MYQSLCVHYACMFLAIYLSIGPSGSPSINAFFHLFPYPSLNQSTYIISLNLSTYLSNCFFVSLNYLYVSINSPFLHLYHLPLSLTYLITQLSFSIITLSISPNTHVSIIKLSIAPTICLFH